MSAITNRPSFKRSERVRPDRALLAIADRNRDAGLIVNDIVSSRPGFGREHALYEYRSRFDNADLPTVRRKPAIEALKLTSAAFHEFPYAVSPAAPVWIDRIAAVPEAVLARDTFVFLAHAVQAHRTVAQLAGAVRDHL